MKLLTSEDFKDHYIDPDSHPFEMLCAVAEVAAGKYEQEHKTPVSGFPKNSVSCIPKKPRSVLKIKHQLNSKKITEKEAGEEISSKKGFHKETATKKSTIGLGHGFMYSDVEESVRKDVAIKNRRLPTISETEPYLNDHEDRFQRLRRNTNLKRTNETLFYDEEWVPEEQTRKRLKTSSRSCGNGNAQKHKATKLKQHLQIVQEPPYDLPEEFKNMINKMGGTEVTLLIQKALFPTDLGTTQNRLSMPFSQIKKADFLREGESQALQSKQAMEVPLIQPSLELGNIKLCKWDMRKASGAISSIYILRSSWNKVAADNQLKENDIVQVWSFRVQEKLCMALVKV